jgi:histidinol dehydrogenase
MKTYINPPEKAWPRILKRPLFDVSDLYPAVQHILQEIKNRGDTALQEYTRKFDGIQLSRFEVSKKEIADAESQLSPELKKAIGVATRNIRTFHASQKQNESKIETTPGVLCWQKQVPIEKVGLYIPGGTAPLFSTVLMLAIPAQIAGCEEIILCSPPDRQGKIHPAILYAAQASGVSNVYRLGGAQAIGAMAYGTETIPKTYKIFGPGNQYVTAAKQLVGGNDVAIDMPAGPSEVAVIADESSDPSFIAADLLSQAEHGADSQVIGITPDIGMISKIEKELSVQLKELSRRDIARQALAHSCLIGMEKQDELIRLINEYAPEHLIIATKNKREIADQIKNAGSVFLGNYTPESAGDYASGTNHTLPTNGWAKSVSGINLGSFMKTITFQEISRQGLLNLGPVIETMAEAEQLTAHKNAVTRRLKKIEETIKP